MSTPDVASFSGRRRQRRTKWTVRAGDVAARLLIEVGGMGTIAAVLMVFVFLVWVALPLVRPARVLGVAQGKTTTGTPLEIAVDEYQSLAWALYPDKVRVLRLDVDHLGESAADLPLPESEAHVTSHTVDRDGRITLGYDDGSIRLGKLAFRTRFLSDDEVGDAQRAMQPDQVRPYENGVVTLLHTGGYRVQQVALELGDATAVTPGDAIVLVDVVERSEGPLTCTLSASGKLLLGSIRQQENLLTGETTSKLSRNEIPFSQFGKAGRPIGLLLSGTGGNAYVAWADGRLARFELGEEPRLMEEAQLLGDKESKLTALKFLIGRSTLIAGTSRGEISAWFVARPGPTNNPDGLQMVKAHDFAAIGSPVVALAPSLSSRSVAACFADGRVRVLQVTSEHILIDDTVLAKTNPSATAGPPPGATAGSSSSAPSASSIADTKALLALAPKDDGLLAVAPDRMVRWRLDEGHPEATLGTLFHPVWYEGYARPAYVWQSTGGTDDFEPKLGMWPLIFGTLKATFYSLLFGVPIALAAAVYTSEFLRPTARAYCKPAIELMAGLPSVVLGFLAALVIAPVAELFVPAILASLVLVPTAFLALAYLWQLVPQRVRMPVSEYRLALIALGLPLGLAASWLAGPTVERVLFAGNLKRWLDGQIGSAAGGWFFFLLPIAAVSLVWIVATKVNPMLRNWARAWSPSQAAAAELIKFILGATATVLLTFAASWLLTALGFDPRGASRQAGGHLVTLGLMDTYVQRNAMVVGFVMGFAIIPIIYTLADDALATVPRHLRSASLGAGATQWQTAARIVIPTAMSGLFSAVMVGVGRAVGETMIVLMAAGNTPEMRLNLFSGLRTLAANLAVELPEAAVGSTHFRTLFLSALVLFGLTFVLNSVAEMVRQRFRRRAYQL